jgi:PAS domain-containing protein
MHDIHLRLQMALSAARMCVWDASVVGNSVLEGTIEWSAEGAALIGLPPVAQCQAFPDYLAMIHSDDRDALLQRMQCAADGCAEYHLGYRIQRPDGSLVWVDSHAVTVCDDGAPVRTLGLIWDDSERRRQEARLFEQKELAEVTLGSTATPSSRPTARAACAS